MQNVYVNNTNLKAKILHRLAVSTAKWLSWLHGFTVVVEAYYVYDNNFLVVSSFRKKEKRPEETRKLYTISPTYQHKPCSQGNQSFFSDM